MAGPDPKELAKGFAVIGAVITAQRMKPRVVRVGHRVQAGVAHGRDLAEYAAEESLRRGAAGSKPWIAVGTVVWGARLGRRLLARRERILLTEPLEPGERIVIHEAPRRPPRGRKARKAAKRAEREAARQAARRRSRRARKAEAKAARRAEKLAARPPTRAQRKAEARAARRAEKLAARRPPRRVRRAEARDARRAG